MSACPAFCAQPIAPPPPVVLQPLAPQLPQCAACYATPASCPSYCPLPPVNVVQQPPPLIPIQAYTPLCSPCATGGYCPSFCPQAIAPPPVPLPPPVQQASICPPSCPTCAPGLFAAALRSLRAESALPELLYKYPAPAATSRSATTASTCSYLPVFMPDVCACVHPAALCALCRSAESVSLLLRSAAYSVLSRMYF
ncbi:hypothetical protein M3Y99_01897800 [Aphelenchoides fujianensis]|nr:hypothetical protein M3Y99_01897800 [Aphelenchoides fujianensis]